MGIDITDEVQKAVEIMARYRMPQDDQIEVVRIILAAVVEHCLQERVRQKNDLVSKAHGLIQ